MRIKRNKHVVIGGVMSLAAAMTLVGASVNTGIERTSFTSATNLNQSANNGTNETTARIAPASLSSNVDVSVAFAQHDDHQGESVVKRESIQFAKVTVKAPGLPVGVKVVTQKGIDGERTFYRGSTEQASSTGESYSMNLYHDAITKTPQDEITLVGTKPSTTAIDASFAKKVKEEARAAESRSKGTESSRGSNSPSNGSEAVRRASEASEGVSTAGGGSSVSENKAFARSILSESEFKCLDSIAQRESGWSTSATNPSSGAYGIPQSLPASKMASAGADWRTNGKTQIKWMVSYLNSRYGSACQAKAFWDANHWY